MRMATISIGLVCLGVTLLWAGTSGADSSLLWSIGRNDDSYGEFAISGKHEDFSMTFPQDVDFKMGSSRAGKDWPFVHPGPADEWAGSMPHTFVVEFKVEKVPRSACRLVVYVNDTNAGSPPVLSVNVNGHECPASQLPGGAGDASLTSPKAGRPFAQPVLFAGHWLRQGANRLSLTVSSGSWLLYDALTLESGLPDAPHIERIAAMGTPMFKKIGESLRQAVRVEVQNTGIEGRGVLRVAGLPGSDRDVDLRQGLQTHFLLTPPFTEAGKRSIELVVGEKTVSAEFDARVEKPYKLFVAASAHTDIGYTDLQEKCMALHVNNAMLSLDAAKANVAVGSEAVGSEAVGSAPTAYSLQPKASLPNFNYNLEVFAQADWIKELKPDSVPALEQAIREHKMGLTALYLNMLTGLC